MSTNNTFAKAKAALILDQPFFAALLLSMPIIEDKSVPTMATNGDELRYNPEFMSSLSLAETVFVLAHETMHCVFQHMHRRGARNPLKYNIAADYIINELLVNERVGAMPKGCLYDTALVAAGKGTTEGVYDLLPKDAENKQAGEPGGALDHVSDAGTPGQPDAATMAQKEAEMRVKIVQAANAAKMAGKLSGGLARIVGEATATRTDWRAVLRRFLSERAKTDLSYAKPKRRFMADDINLPSLTGEKLGAIVIAVDCSGSINEKLLAAFGAEIRAIAQDTQPGAIEVVYFDSQVLKHDSFTAEDSITLTPVGGGGTAFSPIFQHVATLPAPPAACVVLTDLECSDFGPMPEYPVLWATTERGKAPWGEVLHIREDIHG